MRDYDYAEAGAYFVTICTNDRICLFGQVSGETVTLNQYGEIARSEWEQVSAQRPYVQLDTFVVMPNHIHGIIVLTSDNHDLGKATAGAINRAPTEDETRRFGPLATASLSSVISAYKAGVTRQINRIRKASDAPIWQRNYYEHVIRNEPDLDRVRLYIEINPSRWSEDSLYSR